MKEDRRVSITTKGNKKAMLLTQFITLTGSQEQKLNCEPLLPELEKIAKKLEIDWAVELSANIEYGTLAVSRTYESEIGNCEFSSIEKTAKDFLNAVDKLELPKPEPECPSHESDGEEKVQDEESVKEEEKKAKQFIYELLNDLDLPIEHEHHIIGAQILCTGPMEIPFPLPWGRMSRRLLKEMCELYLKEREPIIVYP